MPPNSPNNSNFGALGGGGGGGTNDKQAPVLLRASFWGGGGLGYMGLTATTWVPMGARYPYCHQTTTQTHAKGDRRVSEKVEFPKICKCH